MVQVGVQILAAVTDRLSAGTPRPAMLWNRPNRVTRPRTQRIELRFRELPPVPTEACTTLGQRASEYIRPDRGAQFTPRRRDRRVIHRSLLPACAAQNLGNAVSSHLSPVAA